jgi:hypothetical protein
VAQATIRVIEALREAATRLEYSPGYQWGHMGNCNCGFLAQVVTGQSAPAIHQSAMQGHGDWSEQLNDYCPATGLGINALIDKLIEFGFDRYDLAHLERLTDPIVLDTFPEGGKFLCHNNRLDVIEYYRRWALCIETEWASEQPPIDFNVCEAEI